MFSLLACHVIDVYLFVYSQYEHLYSVYMVPHFTANTKFSDKSFANPAVADGSRLVLSVHAVPPGREPLKLILHSVMAAWMSSSPMSLARHTAISLVMTI